MDIVLPVLGGLALFLYGMNIMGASLEKTAGKKLNRLIEVLTTNRVMAIIVGAVVTMIVQSSSATTVMVIGFVNAGLMTLSQAAGVIMGANIGTTITAQIIALNLTDYAPIAVAIGVALWIGSSREKIQNIAEIFIGFGILFIGMDMMGSGLKPMAHNPVFGNIIVGLENPIMGALAGLLITTVVQSSSASIGLLQALAGEGIIGIDIAFPILFGENIGTTTTALLSSIGANINAKRAAVIHFLFNLIGTIIFMTILRIPVEWLIKLISPNNVQAQIANAHTLFNAINVIIQFPFIGLLVKAAERLVPGSEKPGLESSIYLDTRILETPSIALGQANKEVLRMGELVLENLRHSRKVLADEEYEGIEEVYEKEKLINGIEREITEYLVKLSNEPLSDGQHSEVNMLLYIINDIERVGDHVENIVELSQYKQENDLEFSKFASEGLHSMFDKCEQVFTKAMEAFEFNSRDLASEVLSLEEEVDRLEERNRTDHIDRLNKMECQTGPGIIFLDAISNLERVSDHSSNIATYILNK